MCLQLLLVLLGAVVARQEIMKESARCANQGQVYHPGQAACFPPLDRGPCNKDEMIVLSNATGLGVCIIDACPKPHEVFIDGQCLGEFEFEKCQALGEMIRWTVEGKGECWCEDGWGRLPGSSRCSQQSTQASCPAGQIVREAAHRCSKLDIHEALKGTEDEIEEKVETLKKIHCGGSGGEECCKILQAGSRVDLHLSDILGAAAFQHQKYQCGPNTTPSGNICSNNSRPWPTFSTSQCFLLSNDALSRDGDCGLQLKGDKISCMTDDDLVSIRFATVRKQKCPRGRVWSRLRRRCVRVFK